MALVGAGDDAVKMGHQTANMNTGQTFPSYSGRGIGPDWSSDSAWCSWHQDSPLDWALPVVQGHRARPAPAWFPVRARGWQLVPELVRRLCWRSSLYTAAFIAEIVRAGILAMPQGQTEASYSLGLRPGGVTLRPIVIPQALRVHNPAADFSQYLNLTKNSSLAVAIAYPELVSIFAGTAALNQVGKEIRDDWHDDVSLSHLFDC